MGVKKWKSLKISLFFYLAAALVISVFLSLIVQSAAVNERERIWIKYAEDVSELYEYQNDYIEKFGDLPPVPQVSTDELTSMDAFLVGLCDFLESWSILILSFSSEFIVLTLFYNRRLKRPLTILTESAERIGRQDLDFFIHYEKEDEMGQLCDTFEMMRQQLQDNNQAMWQMLDEQRQMRAAFSHDLRTPLTVMKGYVEFLNRYYPKGSLSEEKVMETLQDLKEQTQRIETFADTMKEINHLDDRVMKKETVDYMAVLKKSEAILEVLGKKYGKEYEIANLVKRDQLRLDLDVYLEILENIAENAMRYAKQTVRLELSDMESWFYINLYDDGKGFSEKDLTEAAKPYYHDRNAEGNHYGMGLYLCDCLCKKHGGRMALGNYGTGGACVKIQLNIK